MPNALLRKGLVVGIILLFIGASVTPSMSEIVDEKSKGYQSLEDIKQNEALQSEQKLDQVLSGSIFFTQNQGQFPDEVLFQTHAPGAILYFCRDKIVTVLTKNNKTSQGENQDVDRNLSSHEEMKEPMHPEMFSIYTEFVGANPKTVVTGEGVLSHYNNYFIGNDSMKWYTNVPNYQRVTYRDLYPGIDLIYYVAASGLKYDFIVHPKADVSQIQVQYTGIKGITIGPQSDLQVQTEFGVIHENTPTIYQKVNSRTYGVIGGYHLCGPDVFGFEVGSYNPDVPLVIDPELMYSTFLGGTSTANDEMGVDIEVDANGYAYTTGWTDSSDFPTTPGAYDTTYNGGMEDIFVTKLSPAGDALVYSTFIGGIGDDYGRYIIVDANGYATITGFTISSNFPTTPDAYDTTYNGGRDVIVTKLSPSGNSLIYSTFLGGTSKDSGIIAMEANGYIYITGDTTSSNFPTTPDAYDTTYNGDEDVFVTKFSPSGNSLVYSTFIGGTYEDICCGTGVDTNGYAYITGSTSSSSFPTTPDAYDTTFNGVNDVFVTKLSPSGDTLVYSTFLGGNSGDRSFDIAVDTQGYAYITGRTDSYFFPTTPDAYDTTYNGAHDVFVTKFSPSGNSLVYSTFIGGTDYDGSLFTQAIGVDANGYATISGQTHSSDFPTTPDAYDTTFNGVNDVFVTKLSPSGNSLIYSTFLGGTSYEDCTHNAVDTNGNVYIIGYTHSSDFPTTPGAYDTTYNGGDYDVFITKLFTGIGGNYPPDLTISENDITFFRNNDQITINADINNYYKQTNNIHYQIIDIYNNQETIIKTGIITFIAANDYATIDKTLILENPENHQIKVIIDPNNEISESNENNNIATRTISVIEGYILTTINYQGHKYYVMFNPKSYSSFSEVKSLFNSKNTNFVDNIEELWIIDSKITYQPIKNSDLISEILFNIVNSFDSNQSYYLTDAPYHSPENAETIGNFVRNAWLLDGINPENWINFVKNKVTGVNEKEERIKLLSSIILGLVSRDVPKPDPIEGALGLGFSLAGCALSIKSGLSGDLTKTINLDKLSDCFKDFIKKGRIIFEEDSIQIEVQSISVEYFSGDEVHSFESASASLIYSKITKEFTYTSYDPSGFSEYFKEMVKNNYEDFLLDVGEQYLDEGRNWLSFEEINNKIIEKQYYPVLNRLRVLHDFLVKYDNRDNDELIEVVDGLIDVMEKSFDSFINTYVNPQPDIFKGVISPLLDASINIIIKEGLKKLIEQGITFAFNQALKSGINFGSTLGKLGASGCVGVALFVVEGLEMGFSISNWVEIRKYADIAKMSTQLGHYVIDTPTYILSQDSGVNDESFYSSALKSLKCLSNGYAYYNFAMVKEKAFHVGIGGSEGWRTAGDDCYTTAQYAEELESKSFILFNQLASKFIDIPLFSISPPEMTTLDTARSRKEMMNVGWLDGGLRFYCTNFDLRLDVTTTKIGDKYLVTIDPFEDAHGLLGGSERIDQMDHSERMRFRVYSSDNKVYEAYWPSFFETNNLHGVSSTGGWRETPFTFEVPWEPTKMEVYYGWWDDVANFWPFDSNKYMYGHHIFNLNTISGYLRADKESSTVSIMREYLKGGSRDVIYSTWDSDSDGFNDALTVNWNLSSYGNIGNVTVMSQVIGGNASGNASTEGMFYAYDFPLDSGDKIFGFDFYANRTVDYDVDLYLLNASTFTVLEDRNLTGIYLHKGSGGPVGKEKIFNVSDEVFDTNQDNIIDSYRINFSVNSTKLLSENCSLLIITKNATGVLEDINCSTFDLSKVPLNLSYTIDDLETGNYYLTMYLADSGFKLEDLCQKSFFIGGNISSVFTEYYYDSGNDTDGDSLYNYLSIITKINVSEPGNYTLVGKLENSSGYQIARISTIFNITDGSKFVTLNFNASLFSIQNINDSYVLSSLSLYDSGYNLIEACSPNYTTNYYNVTSFEDSPILFTALMTDGGVDTDSDGYYNYLRINVSVNVNFAGNYSFWMKINNNTGNNSMYQINSSELTVGNHELVFLLDGILLREYMLNTTYIVESIEVYDENGYLGTYYPSYITDYYEFIDFQPMLHILNSYSEDTIDSNSNGYYDFLAIDFDVEVYIPGNYTVQCDLLSSDGLLVDTFEDIIQLSLGNQTVTLLFNGSSLFLSRNNTYYVLKNLIIKDDHGRFIDSRGVAYTTQTYSYAIFERPVDVLCIGQSDSAIDEDGNGFYDYLLINLSVIAENVSSPGFYLIRGYLYDSNGYYIGFSSDLLSVYNGTQITNLSFPSSLIASQSNGTFNLSYVEVYDDKSQLIFFGEIGYITQNYNPDLFRNLWFVTNLSENWNFVSVPYNQSVNKLNLIIKYNGSEYSWQDAVNQSIVLGFIYTWNKTAQNYGLTDTLTPGQGCWMYAYHDCEIWAKGVTLFASDPYVTDLIRYWNIMGVPDNEPVQKQNLTIRYNGTVYTWQEAITNNIILDFIYQWNESNQHYQLTDILQPGKSNWMYAYHNCTLYHTKPIPDHGNCLYVGGSGLGNYTTIQSAINAASNGDTVFVYTGTYYENVYIDKSINLIGESRDGVIVDGMESTVISAIVPYVNITTITVMNALDGSGIRLYQNGNRCHIHNIRILTIENVKHTSLGIYSSTDNNTINDNYVINCNNDNIIVDSRNCFVYNNTIIGGGYGISIEDQYNTVHNNSISGSSFIGINDWVGNNSINNNIISNCERGIRLIYCNSTHVFNNNIINCLYGMIVWDTNINQIYHNNFLANTNNAKGVGTNNNTWDDGYPSGGNYWDDYTGQDNFNGPNQSIPGPDGIGDTPYPIPGCIDQDNYPLMQPWDSGDLTPVADFYWSPSNPIPGETITFNASDSYDIDGYITLYEWDWESDGNYDESYSIPTVTHSWADSGYHSVTLRVGDNTSKKGFITKTLIINAPPVADFYWSPSNPIPGETITFNASASYDPDGWIVWYEWDWDDDGIFDETNGYPETWHTWWETGSYPVSLRVTDNDGYQDTITQTVFIDGRKSTFRS